MMEDLTMPGDIRLCRICQQEVDEEGHHPDCPLSGVEEDEE